MTRYLRRHLKDCLLLLLVVLMTAFVVTRSEAVVVLPLHAEPFISNPKIVHFEEKELKGKDQVITKRPAVIFAQRPVERPIEEGIIESQDIAENPLSDLLEVPIDIKSLKTIITPVKTQQVEPASEAEKVDPKALIKKAADNKPAKAELQSHEETRPPVIFKPKGKPELTVPARAEQLGDRPAKALSLKKPALVKPSVPKGVPEPVKVQRIAPQIKPVLTMPVPLKTDPLDKKAIKAPAVEKPAVLKARPTPEKESQPPLVSDQKPSVKAVVVKPLQHKSTEKKPTETTKVDEGKEQAADKVAEDKFSKDKADQYTGPIEVRVKRLFGFDAQLSGTLLGWVDQIYIDELNDEIYLLDKNSKRIVVTNLLGGYLFHFNYVLAGVKNPIAFTVDSLSGEIYLSDSNRIAILNYRGEYQGDFNLSQMPGSKNIFIQSLRLVKSDEGDLLYIGDNKNRRIVVFTTGGKYVRTIGADRWVGNNIKGLYINKDTIFWLDSTGFSVKSVDLDGKNQRSFGRLSSLLGGFSMPSNMAIDDVNKRIIVVDANRMMIIFFDFEGNTLFEFGGPRLFSWPRAIAVDKNGYVFVADNSGVIRVFNIVPLDK